MQHSHCNIYNFPQGAGKEKNVVQRYIDSAHNILLSAAQATPSFFHPHSRQKAFFPAANLDATHHENYPNKNSNIAAIAALPGEAGRVPSSPHRRNHGQP